MDAPRHPHPRPADSSARDPVGDLVYLFDPASEAHGPVIATPTELFALLGGALQSAGLGDVVVTATVSGLRRRPRWASFDLIDQGPEAQGVTAKLQVVVFARALARIEQALATDGARLGDGMTATVTGRLDWDPPWGSLRLVADAVVAREQRGAMAAQRDALVAELTTTGVRRAQKALVVPGRPLRIGLLSGPETAGTADVRALLDHSGVEWRLSVLAAPMAGPAAPQAIAAGIDSLAASGPDVIVVARGGGARNELAAFDSAVVATAIARCPVPVWTAIGHATDTTVADLVANHAFATPSAAAAALVERVRSFEHHRHQRQVLVAHTEALAAVRRGARLAWTVAALAVLVTALVLVAILGLI